MPSRFKKAIATTLILSLLIPVAFITVEPAQKADAAAASCATQLAGLLGASGASKALGSVLAVPDNPVTILTDTSATAASTGGVFIKDCILTPLAITMARTMIRNISNSIVNWINTGFNGKPSFVTDIRGLADDSADEAVGNFINGTDLNFLCSPFSFQIRLALATKYNKTFPDQVKCTLTDITNNVNNFAANNGQAGWDHWLSITTEPQNNVYGAYLMADSKLTQNIQTKLTDVNNMLNRNGGFLDFQTCDQYETPLEASTRASGGVTNTLSGSDIANGLSTQSSSQASFAAFNTGSQNIDFGNGKSVTLNTPSQLPSFATSPTVSSQPQCKKMSTKTPGTLVQAQATKVLGGWADQLNLATDIDQIVGALVSHFADKMVSGAQGFLGLSGSKGYASTNVNYADAATLSADTSNPENAGLSDVNTAAQTSIDSALTAIQVIDTQSASYINGLNGVTGDTGTTTATTTTTINPDGSIATTTAQGGIETLTINPPGAPSHIGYVSNATLQTLVNTDGNAVVPSIEINLYRGNTQVSFNSVLVNGSLGLTQNGIMRTFYPQTSSGITFGNVSVGPSYNTIISLSGVGASQAGGSYTLILVAKDSAGNTLRSASLNFVVE